MLNKLRRKLRDKLRGYLGINELSHALNHHVNEISSDTRGLGIRIRKLYSHQKASNQQIAALHNTLQSTVSMGSDIVPLRHGSSWAVVCIEGKYNIVKFIDLSKKDAGCVIDFLKQFEGARYVNDTPMAYLPKEMFVDWD